MQAGILSSADIARGFSVLHKAVLEGNVELVSTVIKDARQQKILGPLLSACTKQNETIFHLVFERKDPDEDSDVRDAKIIDMLIAACSEVLSDNYPLPNLFKIKSSGNKNPKDNETPRKIIRSVLKETANDPDNPVHQACLRLKYIAIQLDKLGSVQFAYPSAFPPAPAVAALPNNATVTFNAGWQTSGAPLQLTASNPFVGVAGNGSQPMEYKFQLPAGSSLSSSMPESQVPFNPFNQAQGQITTGNQSHQNQSFPGFSLPKTDLFSQAARMQSSVSQGTAATSMQGVSGFRDNAGPSMPQAHVQRSPYDFPVPIATPAASTPTQTQVFQSQDDVEMSDVVTTPFDQSSSNFSQMDPFKFTFDPVPDATSKTAGEVVKASREQQPSEPPTAQRQLQTTGIPSVAENDESSPAASATHVLGIPATTEIKRDALPQQLPQAVAVQHVDLSVEPPRDEQQQRPQDVSISLPPDVARVPHSRKTPTPVPVASHGNTASGKEAKISAKTVAKPAPVAVAGHPQPQPHKVVAIAEQDSKKEAVTFLGTITKPKVITKVPAAYKKSVLAAARQKSFLASKAAVTNPRSKVPTPENKDHKLDAEIPVKKMAAKDEKALEDVVYTLQQIQYLRQSYDPKNRDTFQLLNRIHELAAKAFDATEDEEYRVSFAFFMALVSIEESLVKKPKHQTIFSADKYRLNFPMVYRWKFDSVNFMTSPQHYKWKVDDFAKEETDKYQRRRVIKIDDIDPKICLPSRPRPIRSIYPATPRFG